MSNRITIPSSEPKSDETPEDRARPTSWRAGGGSLLVIVLGVVVAGAWFASQDQIPETGDSAEIAAPVAPEEVFPSEPEPATRGSTVLVSSSVVPGVGAVVAGFDREGVQHLVVSEERFSTSRSILWRREAAAWVVAGAIDGPVTHATDWNGQVVAVGTDRFLAEPTVHIGEPGEMATVEIGGSNEVALRVEALGDQVAVYSQGIDSPSSYDGTLDLRADTGFVARLSADGQDWAELGESVFDLSQTSRGLLAVGESGGDPRIWQVSEDGGLEDVDLVPPSEYRPVSILEDDGGLMILAIKRGFGRDAEIWQTVGGQLAVVATLDTSVWSRLERRGEEYVAFGDGSYYAASDDGRDWNIVALRHDVPDHWRSRSARVTETGLQFYGARVDGFGEPVVLSPSAEIPFTLPEPEWELVERLPDEFIAFDPGVRGDIAVAAPTGSMQWGRLMFRSSDSDDWQETDGPQVSQWHQVVETEWGWVLQSDGSTLRSVDGLGWEEVVQTRDGGTLSSFDGDVAFLAWSGGEPHVIGERTVTPLPAVERQSSVGYVDGLGAVAVNTQSSPTALRLVDGEWQPLDVESVPGWPSFVFGRLYANDFAGSRVFVFDPSSGEFVKVDGPSERGQVFTTDLRSVTWFTPLEGVFVADESLRWHRVTFDPAAGVVERVASAVLIDGAIVVTARGTPRGFSEGPVSIYTQPAG